MSRLIHVLNGYLKISLITLCLESVMEPWISHGERRDTSQLSHFPSDLGNVSEVDWRQVQQCKWVVAESNQSLYWKPRQLHCLSPLRHNHPNKNKQGDKTRMKCLVVFHAISSTIWNLQI